MIKPLAAQQGRERLERICFKIKISDDGIQNYWGTGFFISEDGTALTAKHNIPLSIQKRGQGEVDVYYNNRWLRLTYSGNEANQQDIAVLALTDPSPQDLQPSYVPIAYPPLDSLRDRQRFWAGRPICLFGFPCEPYGQGTRFIDGTLDSVQPLVEIDEVDEQDNIVGTLRRLRFRGTRAEQLEGISGAPMLDRDSGYVIGVEGSYQPNHNIVYGSEIADLLEACPRLLDYSYPLMTVHTGSTVFVLMPLGQSDQEHRRWKDIYDNILLPRISESGLQPVRSDEINLTGNLIADIVISIWTARVVIADISELNPVVMYELGIAHSIARRVIIIGQQEEPPNLLKSERFISYNKTKEGGGHPFTDKLSKALESASEPGRNAVQMNLPSGFQGGIQEVLKNFKHREQEAIIAELRKYMNVRYDV